MLGLMIQCYGFILEGSLLQKKTIALSNHDSHINFCTIKWYSFRALKQTSDSLIRSVQN